MILASGCQRALEICMTGLAEVGQNILIPSPAFSVYKTICQSYGFEERCYKCIVSLFNHNIIYVFHFIMLCVVDYSWI